MVDFFLCVQLACLPWLSHTFPFSVFFVFVFCFVRRGVLCERQPAGLLSLSDSGSPERTRPMSGLQMDFVGRNYGRYSTNNGLVMRQRSLHTALSGSDATALFVCVFLLILPLGFVRRCCCTYTDPLGYTNTSTGKYMGKGAIFYGVGCSSFPYTKLSS